MMLCDSPCARESRSNATGAAAPEAADEERDERREDAARGPHVPVYGSRARRFVLRERRESLTPRPSPGTLAA